MLELPLYFAAHCTAWGLQKPTSPSLYYSLWSFISPVSMKHTFVPLWLFKGSVTPLSRTVSLPINVTFYLFHLLTSVRLSHQNILSFQTLIYPSTSCTSIAWNPALHPRVLCWLTFPSNWLPSSHPRTGSLSLLTPLLLFWVAEPGRRGHNLPADNWIKIHASVFFWVILLLDNPPSPFLVPLTVSTEQFPFSSSPWTKAYMPSLTFFF